MAFDLGSSRAGFDLNVRKSDATAGGGYFRSFSSAPVAWAAFPLRQESNTVRAQDRHYML